MSFPEESHGQDLGVWNHQDPISLIHIWLQENQEAEGGLKSNKLSQTSERGYFSKLYHVHGAVT